MKKLDAVSIFVFYYIGWFGSVYLAKTEYSYLALLFPAALLLFAYFKKQLSPKFLYMVFGLSLVGIAFDSLMIGLEFVRVAAPSVLLIPLWLIAIWLLFTVSMLQLGAQFRISIYLSALLGFILGPLSYKAGEVFEVLFFAHPFTFWVYAVFWAILFPIVIQLPKKVL